MIYNKLKLVQMGVEYDDFVNLTLSKNAFIGLVSDFPNDGKCKPNEGALYSMYVQFSYVILFGFDS